MWLLVYVPAVFGIMRYRYWAYWRWVVVMLFWQSAGQFLLAGGGTLEDPTRDGLVSRIARQATDDGFGFALYAIASVVIFWGGVFYILRRLQLDAKSGHSGAASPPRKTLEIIALTAVIGGLLYANLSAMLGSAGAEAKAEDPQTLETRIDVAAAEVNKGTPFQLDDVTILDRVSREGRAIVYHYSITSSAIPRETLEQYLHTDKFSEACANSGNQAMLQAGATVRYRYQLPSGSAPLSVDMTAELCRKPAAKQTAPQNSSSISR